MYEYISTVLQESRKTALPQYHSKAVPHTKNTAVDFPTVLLKKTENVMEGKNQKRCKMCGLYFLDVSWIETRQEGFCSEKCVKNYEKNQKLITGGALSKYFTLKKTKIAHGIKEE